MLKLSSITRCLLLASSLASIAACGGGGSSGGSGGGSGGGAGMVLPVLQQPLSALEGDSLLFIREEEKLARDVYLTLYDQWAEVTFQTIATRSEQTHMDKIKLLLDAAGLADPVGSNGVGVFNNAAIADLYAQLVAQGSTSLTEALKVGAFIEEYDIKDLQEAVVEATDGTNQLAVIQTYNNLICGSRNHLRSFVSLIELAGIVYTAQLLPQATVDAIVDSPMEQCGRQ